MEAREGDLRRQPGEAVYVSRYMELTHAGSVRWRALPHRLAQGLAAPAIAAWVLAFALVAYLALSNGGYDTVVRSQVGVAVWWIVLLAALAGILPSRLGTAGWVAIGLLSAFAVWTGLATGWSESAERSAVELGRVATYLGVLVLAIAVQGRSAARHTINGVASAIGLVALLAVLSRLHPQSFPVNDHIDVFGEATARRLSYPLNYWNGLAAFAAMGVPLLLAVAVGARTLAGQAAAAAALPLSALCIYLTISRGGTLALVVGLAAFLALMPLRLRAMGTLLVAAAGSVILISAVSQRDALQNGVPTPTAISQGNEVLWLVLVVCTGVALLQVAMGLAARHLPVPAVLAPSRRQMAVRALAVFGVAAAIGIGAGVPGAVNDRWQQFKAAPGTVAAASLDDVFSRLQSVEGTGRYQIWQAAADANATAPWKGIGPGTFEFWWARHGTLGATFVRDAHSLYVETFAETGIVGVALLAGLLLLLAGAAVVRSLRAPPGLRLWIAAAAGGMAAFMTIAALEWVWEMAAIAAAALVLGAVIVAGRDDLSDQPDPDPDPTRRRAAPRAVLSLLAVASLVAIVLPMAAALATARQPRRCGRRSPRIGARGDAQCRATPAVRRDAATAAGPRVGGGRRARWRRCRRTCRHHGGADELAYVACAGPCRGSPRQRRRGPAGAPQGAAAQPQLPVVHPMTSQRDIRRDLGADAPHELVSLAERLEHERPVPAAAFRGALKRRLLAGGVPRARPRRLRALITGYAAAGSLLLLVGTVSAAGAGPLGA